MPLWSDVEREYGIQIEKRKKVRDVYRLHTRKHGILCLKSYEVPEEEVRFLASVFRQLADAGFNQSPRLLSTTGQTDWIASGGRYYMLTNWVDGSAPDFARKSHFKKALRALARFHLHAEGFAPSDVPPARQRAEGLPNMIRHYRSELERHKRLRKFVLLCDKALAYLEQAPAVRAVEQEQACGAFVHGDYNYPNLVLDARRAVHLIDFENSSLLPRMTDLCHILHRNCAWRGTKTLRAIKTYERIRPLSGEDKYLLYALLHVPYPIVRAIRMHGSSYARHVELPKRRQIRRYCKRIEELIR